MLINIIRYTCYDASYSILKFLKTFRLGFAKYILYFTTVYEIGLDQSIVRYECFLINKFLYLRRYIAIANVPYRMLAHSHSATSLYNFSQSAIRLHRVRHLTCERAWFGLVLFRRLYCVCHFGTDFYFKNILILS